MCAESTGDAHVISDKDTLGLMQVMPATYAEVRARHRLGADMFYPRDNILAGTANMRDMRDRFGWLGFLAVYHTGPARYDDYPTSGRPLPEKSRRSGRRSRAAHRHENAGISIDRHHERCKKDAAVALCRARDPQDESTANVCFLQFGDHSTAIRNVSDLRVGRAPNDRRRAFRALSDRLIFNAASRGFRPSFVSFTARSARDGDDDFFGMMLCRDA